MSVKAYRPEKQSFKHRLTVNEWLRVIRLAFNFFADKKKLAKGSIFYFKIKLNYSKIMSKTTAVDLELLQKKTPEETTFADLVSALLLSLTWTLQDLCKI